MTDLAITTARNETYTFEIRVLADLSLIQDKLRATFPDASVKLSQIRDHFVVEGEARTRPRSSGSSRPSTRILSRSISSKAGPPQLGRHEKSWERWEDRFREVMCRDLELRCRGSGAQVTRTAVQPGADDVGTQANPFTAYAASAELAGPTQLSNRGAQPQIINLFAYPRRSR